MARQMKDSGVEWIGKIPDNWSVFKTLRLLDMPITDGPHETPSLYDEGIPFISAEAVSCGCGGIDFSRKRGYISREYYVECCKKYTPRLHDIYMIKSGATTGRVSMVDTEVEFAIWSPLAVFRANPKKIAPRYLFYSLQADYYQNQISLSWSFGTQQNIGMRVLEQLKLAVPVVEEQQKLVGFLDSKCTEIDKVVEQTRATIEEYKKLKQAIITEAVTKGVRGPRSMKPSGVEWIGDIPEEWEACKLKYLLAEKLTYGANETADGYNPSHPRYIRITDIAENGKLKDDSAQSLLPEIAEPYLLKKGDILLARSGATAGKSFLFNEGIEACFAGYLIRARVNNKIISKFLYYYTKSKTYTNWCQIIQIQSTIQNISGDKYINLMVTVPSEDEQQEIVSFLDTKCAEIDRIIEKKEQLIEELGSYKKSLIYECVTGKREIKIHNYSQIAIC